MFLGRDNGVLKSETLNLVQNNRVNSLALLFVTPVQISVHPYILIKLCRLIAFFQNINLNFLLPLK